MQRIMTGTSADSGAADATQYTTAEGLRYYVVDGKARWSPPPPDDEEDDQTVPSSTGEERDGVSTPAAVDALHELHTLCHEQHFMAPPIDVLPLAARLDGLKTEVVTAARRSHTLQLELQELEKTIALHISHRMEVEAKAKGAKPPPTLTRGATSAMAVGGLSQAPRLSPSDKQNYETLVYLLRVHPSWLAQVVVAAGHKDRPQLLRTLLFVLYAKYARPPSAPPRALPSAPSRALSSAPPRAPPAAPPRAPPCEPPMLTTLTLSSSTWQLRGYARRGV